MYITRSFVFTVFIILFFTSCNSNLDQIHQFQKEETLALNQNIETVLSSLKYENYKIQIISHLQYSRVRISERKSYESFRGADDLLVTLGAPSGAEPNTPPGYLKNGKNQSSSYYKRDSTVNYDTAKQEYTYHIDYFSVLIIFDKINATEKNKVANIIERTALNLERGDIVEILSKE
ncbi:hypothetical protein AB3N59_08400 [Leptospira sp. WS92.C1]